MRALGLGLTIAATLAGCGGDVSADAAGAGAGGGSSGRGGSAAGGSNAGGSGGSPARDAGFDVFVDPGCPEAPPPDERNECDPFAGDSGCRFDEGCYPFVQYPSGDPCAAETFGTRCMPAGTGSQGADCENARCAPGFICIVGGAPGARCARLCPVFGQETCPAGLVCEPVDIEQGYGGCI
jgi:hypothetical protein